MFLDLAQQASPAAAGAPALDTLHVVLGLAMAISAALGSLAEILRRMNRKEWADAVDSKDRQLAAVIKGVENYAGDGPHPVKQEIAAEAIAAGVAPDLAKAVEQHTETPKS